MKEIDFERYPLTGWFPGHMMKAEKAMQEALKLVDLVVELIDARAPRLSRNPELRELLQNRPFVTVANKADLADPKASQSWVNWYADHGERLFLLDSRRSGSIRGLPVVWRKVIMEERARRGATRPLARPVRIMIAGVPNIGKSTLVNHLLEKNRAQVGPKPGVTRQNQWVPLSGNVELLDTPGILWPKIQSKRHELLLALLGNLKEEVVDVILLADYLSSCLSVQKHVRWDVLGLEGCPEQAEDVLVSLARRRGLLQTGGVPDLERAARVYLKEFRDGRLGRFTLDFPEDA